MFLCQITFSDRTKMLHIQKNILLERHYRFSILSNGIFRNILLYILLFLSSYFSQSRHIRNQIYFKGPKRALNLQMQFLMRSTQSQKDCSKSFLKYNLFSETIYIYAHGTQYTMHLYLCTSKTVWPCNLHKQICIILVQHIILFSNLPLCCSVYLYQFGKHPTSVHIEIHANPSLILPSP